jgi:hypothetical protein
MSTPSIVVVNWSLRFSRSATRPSDLPATPALAIMKRKE